MAMRLQEIHPSVVHFPLAFLPLALGADALGLATRDRALLQLGRRSIGLAAASAGVSGLTGLIAQEEARAEGRAHDALVTHRNLNTVGLGVMTGMALWRRNRRPGRGYLAVGLGLLGTTLYTAYLGGKMVYEHGVGVKEADGLREGASPELTPREAGRVARHALSDLGRGVRHAWQDLRDGELVPALRRNGRNGRAGRRAGGDARAAASRAAETGAGEVLDESLGGGAEWRDEMRFTRFYTNLVLAADNLDARLVRHWILEWGDLDVPRVRGRTLLELALADELPTTEKVRLVRALLRAGATATDGALDRAIATGRGHVFAPVLEGWLATRGADERDAALEEAEARLAGAPPQLRRVLERRRTAPSA